MATFYQGDIDWTEPFVWFVLGVFAATDEGIGNAEGGEVEGEYVFAGAEIE